MSDQESTDQPLPLVTHLTELRDKLLRALLAVLLVFIACFRLPTISTHSSRSLYVRFCLQAQR